ncbi:MAG: hypothetical protein AAGC68_14730 [Verrucomicrobiota bacterium]
MIMLRFRYGAFLFSFAVLAIGSTNAQEETDPVTAALAGSDSSEESGKTVPAEAADSESVTEETNGSGKPDPSPDRNAENKSAKSPEELREEMLEQLADQLSRRMKALREREAAVTVRERSLSEREEAAEERERMLGSLEELMQLREEVIKRREKLPPPQTWSGPEAPGVYGKYAAVLDGQTMQFFHKKAASARVPVASTQKLVTALVICHDGDLDRLVEVPREVYEVEPTVVGVKPGQLYSRRQLLTSLLVKSGNDIAATLAIDNSGSVAAFAEKMNTYARYIGMTDSNFVNPHGLPAEGQYSTARDIAIAAFEAYQVPAIREMVNLRTYEFVFTDGNKRMLYNTNKVLGALEGCNGMKTGFTYAAGNCLVCSTSVEGKDRISVVLKSARPHVWEDSKKLLTWSLGLEFTGPLEEEQFALAQ